jgi:hypothetical protein
MEWLVWLVIPLFAFLDRLWGSDGGFKGRKGLILAASVFGPWAAFSVSGYPEALWWREGLPAASLGLLWSVYRSLPFPGNSQTPVEAEDFFHASVRHGLVLPPAFFVAVICKPEQPMGLALAFTGFAAAAVGLAAWYGRANAKAKRDNRPIGKENQAVEVLRGAAYGLAMALGLA